MIVDVVGYQHKTGTVEGRVYDFFELHTHAPNADVEGQAVSVVKLKPEILADALAEVGGMPQNLIGKRLFIDYDAKLRPYSCDIVPEKG